VCVAAAAAVSGMPHKFDCVTAKNSPQSSPQANQKADHISHWPREFPLCLMQISHVLLLFILLHCLGSAKCQVRHFAYYL